MHRFRFIIIAFLFVRPMVATAQDKLPAGAVARLGVHRMRVARPIVDSAFSPDGRTFVVVCDEKDGRANVILFDVASGLERKRLDIDGARHIAMARDKPLMVVDSNQHLEVWDLSTEKRLKQWDTPIWQNRARALAISRDGAHVVAAGESNGKGTLYRWDAVTGAALWNVSIPNRRFDTVSFADDGRKILTAIAIDRLTELDYALESLQGPLFWVGQFGGVRGLFLHNAWTIGYQYRKNVPTIAVWDAQTGKKQSEMLNLAYGCVFAPDGSMMARQTEHGGEIWQMGADPKWIAGMDRLGRFDRCLFAGDGKHLVFGEGVSEAIDFYHTEGQIVIWDIGARREVRRFRTNRMARDLRVSPDGKVIAVQHRDSHLDGYWFVEFFDLSTGDAKCYPTGAPGAIEGLAFSPDGKRLATFSRDTLLLYDLKTGTELRRWIGHPQSIQHIAFTPDGKVLASASVDTDVAFWDAATGAERARMKPKHTTAAVTFSPDGKMLFTASQEFFNQGDGTTTAWLESWEVATGNPGTARPLPHARMAIPALAASGNWLAYVDYAHSVMPKLHVWPTRIGYPTPASPQENERGVKRVRTIDLLRHPSEAENSYQGTKLWGFVISSDGKLLATSDSRSVGFECSDHVIRVWQTASQREILRFDELKLSTALLAISPDCRTLARGAGNPDTRLRFGDEAVFLHDISAAQGGVGTSARSLRGHLGSITCLAFSHDSKLVATGGSDGIVYIWQVDQFVQPNPVPEWKKDLAELWPFLADANPGKAHRALAQLELRPKETLTLLRAHLKPAAKLDAKVLAQHLRDLANASFAVRQRASAALEDAGAQAVPLLEQALKTPASLEGKRRIETLLEQLDRPLERPDQIRAYRALTLLERIGSPDARKLLDELAQGEPTAWLTVEARHSLERLRHRP